MASAPGIRCVGNVCACATEPINATALSAARILQFIIVSDSTAGVFHSKARRERASSPGAKRRARPERFCPLILDCFACACDPALGLNPSHSLYTLTTKSAHDCRLRVHLQRCDKRFLRDVHLAELAHLLLAGLLLLEQFALASGVAAVALCRDVLAERPDCFARDDLAADRGLHGNLEHVRRDEVF